MAYGDSNDNFWGGLRDTFSQWFGGNGTNAADQVVKGQPASTGYDFSGNGPGGQTNANSYDTRSVAEPGGWGSAFKSIGHEMAGPAAQLGMAGIMSKIAPSTPTRIITPDTRTAEGRSAEGLRLQNASSASTALENARQGQLDPYLEHETRRSSRAADAARGMLDTGGSAVRETNAVNQQVQNVLNREGGNVNNFTSGYHTGWPVTMPGHENPWAKLATAALAKPVGNAATNLYDKWAI